MVSVIELTKPIKVSGRHSFLVKSDVFDADVADAISQLPVFRYHKSAAAWEVPADCLAQLLDALTFVADVRLTLAPDGPACAGLPPLTDDEIAAFKVRPYEHQIEAINFGLASESGKWLLLDAPGVGKSLEMMYYAETLKGRGLIDHCLLIVGVAALRQQWKRELQKFSRESVVVLGEKTSKSGKVSYAPVKERAEQLKAGIDAFWIVMNVECLRDDRIIDAFQKSKSEIGLICFDEIHRGVASKSSQSAAGLLKLRPKYRVGATGSLIVNSPVSAYVSLSWTENDPSSLTTFKSQYCEFANSFGHNQIVGYKNLDLLQEEIDGCGIRRTFAQVKSSMPKKTVDVELVEMDDRHAKFYGAVKAGVKEEVDKVKLNAQNLLALTTRLRQATACPGMLTTEDVPASKLERAAEIVEDLVEQGEKVIVMDTFKDSIYSLAKMLDRHKPVIGTGDLPDSAVSENISKFRTDPDCKVLLGTSQKIGTGFSMPECHYMVMISTPWTYSEFNQNCERIYRITSDQPVCVKVLVAKDTIDERVWSIVNEKKDLADYLVDGVANSKFVDALRDAVLSL